MYFILTNTIAISAIVIFFIGAVFIEKFSYKRLTIFNISAMGMLVALSIVLTNVIGYNIRIMGSSFMIGNFVIFLSGMLFGPLAGIINAMAADLTGFIINSAGEFNAGYMFIKVMYGVMGAMVFLDRKTSWWIIKTIVYMAICSILHLMVFNPILILSKSPQITSVGSFFHYYWLYLGGISITGSVGIPKPLLFIVQCPIYASMVIVSFRVTYFLVARVSNREQTVWCAKHGDLTSILRKVKKLRIGHKKKTQNFEDVAHQKSDEIIKS
ncbi:folate family ECF transporter S component [Williamsoniiplasma lucivorax]|uniref:ECF transporter S component n=1 Tax=Williamsoniiplasma lucivorax TaxID=209274 RepID=A0A2S5RFB5_9MOLU|nr:folate family ECF transporter S component [Williamsoniiplasma lucivorax]PPE05825.1 hypothetical protein ELUCI_v1c01130 [Williamsoniiplasma lucivorax]